MDRHSIRVANTPSPPFVGTHVRFADEASHTLFSRASSPADRGQLRTRQPTPLASPIAQEFLLQSKQITNRTPGTPAQYVFWYSHSGHGSLAHPPVIATATIGHLFVYRDLDLGDDDDDVSVWVIGRGGEWEVVEEKSPHPLLHDRGLRVANGEPNWLKYNSFKRTENRVKEREASQQPTDRRSASPKRRR
ncbi:hypothetical protein K488DRAFT_90957 [Vararia minispora EC-137]|uniref:Uncharacterized protein n=1 Tax=Vararia minispora EC-137 TaxID=1314806 RepID=A0ACB8Q7H0_9AGAM|nr:hypothetical protein K488DRAFT_90957 [Vararia minispora EC-137]